MQKPHLICILLGALWISLSLASFVWLHHKLHEWEHMSIESDYHMAAPDNFGKHYHLTSHMGQIVTPESFPSRYKLIYFGFTYCPDICPTSLHKMISAFSSLPEKMQDRIQPLFITVDPERDTPEILAEYVPLFHPKLIGLTGSRDYVDEAIKSFKVYAQKDDSADSEYYLYNHSSFIYLMAPDNTLVTVFSHDTDTKTLAKKLYEALAKP